MTGSSSGTEPAGRLDMSFAAAQTVSGALSDRNGNLVGTVQVKVGRASRSDVVNVSATALLMDGKKVSARAVKMTVDRSGAWGGGVSFKNPIGLLALSAAADGSFTLSNESYEMTVARIGGALSGNAAQGTFALDEGFNLVVPGELQEELLPMGETFTVANSKWKFAKNATVKVKANDLLVDSAGDKTNLSSLKLTYTSKTGLFKGSFKAYALEEATNGKMKLKKYTVKVTGVVVDGTGHGQATCKKPAGGPWAVTVQ